MRAGFAAVVVCVNEIDPDALEPLQTFPRAVVSCQKRADLRVVQGHRAQENARAVQVKVPTVDPEFAVTERNPKVCVQHTAVLYQRKGDFKLIGGRVNVPKRIRFPLLREDDPSADEVAAFERGTRELPELAAIP